MHQQFNRLTAVAYPTNNLKTEILIYVEKLKNVLFIAVDIFQLFAFAPPLFYFQLLGYICHQEYQK